MSTTSAASWRTIQRSVPASSWTCASPGEPAPPDPRGRKASPPITKSPCRRASNASKASGCPCPSCASRARTGPTGKAWSSAVRPTGRAACACPWRTSPASGTSSSCSTPRSRKSPGTRTDAISLSPRMISTPPPNFSSRGTCATSAGSSTKAGSTSGSASAMRPGTRRAATTATKTTPCV